ncbi:MAG: hypothetical protein JW873_07365 [Candidatus Saganbacteria bacterium]|nr:hypothetical protein [Candidatus Saganbacteria bacterium]
MKRILIAGALAAAVASGAHALFFMTADGLGAGKVSLTGAFVLPSAGATEIAARLSYGFTPDVDGYGRLAVQSASGSSSSWLGLGAKGLWQKVSADLPCDLAWLGDFGYFNQNSLQTVSLTGGVVLSRKLDDKWTPGGVVGLNYSSVAASLPGGGTSTTTGTSLVLSGGAAYAATDKLNVKGEIMVTVSQGSSSTGAGLAGEYRF